jgi:hypothetical protein
LVDNLGRTLDIMVVWTKKSECAASSLSDCILTLQTEANMRGLIELAIEETNTAFTLSGVNAQLRLVHAYRDPIYVEVTSSGDAFFAALADITGTSDGKMDDVHVMRSKVGADLVVLLINDPEFCGTAWPSSSSPSKAYMFSVVAWNCATGHYSFAHEVAHSMVSICVQKHMKTNPPPT